MSPVIYRVLSKHVAVMRGRIMLGRIVYRPAFEGWTWAPLNSTDRSPAKMTWSECVADVEAWIKETGL